MNFESDTISLSINEDNITTQVGGQGGPLTTAELKACVSDAALLLNSVFCGVPPQEPQDNVGWGGRGRKAWPQFERGDKDRQKTRLQ